MKADTIENRIDLIEEAIMSIHNITDREDNVIDEDFTPVINTIKVALDEESITPGQRQFLEKVLRQLTSS